MISHVSNKLRIKDRLYVEFRAGTNIHDAMAKMWELAVDAYESARVIVASFNGVEIILDGREESRAS